MRLNVVKHFKNGLQLSTCLTPRIRKGNTQKKIRETRNAQRSISIVKKIGMRNPLHRKETSIVFKWFMYATDRKQTLLDTHWVQSR